MPDAITEAPKPPAPIALNATEIPVAMKAGMGAQGPELFRGLTSQQQERMQAALVFQEAGKTRAGMEAIAKGEKAEFKYGNNCQPAVEAIYLSDTGPDGKKIARDPAEDTDKNDATNRMAIYREYVTQGFDKLDPAKQARLISDLKTKALSNPELRGLLADDSGAISDEVIKDVLRSNSDGLTEWLNGFFNPENPQVKALTERDKNIRKQSGDIKAKEAEKKLKQKEIDDIKDAPKKALEYDKLVAKFNEPTFQTNTTIDVGIKGFVNNLTELDRVKAELVNKPNNADLLKRQAEVSGWIEKAKGDATYGKDCIQLAELHSQRETTNKNLGRQGELPTLETDLQKLTNDEINLQAGLNDLLRERGLLAGDLQMQLEHAVEASVFQKAAQNAVAMLNELPKFKGEAKSQLEKEVRDKLLEIVGTRYTKPANWWERRTKGDTVLDGKKISEDFKILTSKDEVDSSGRVKENGPKGLLRDYLKKAGKTSAEIDSLLQDPAFVKDSIGVILPHMLTDYVLTGKHLTNSEMNALQANPILKGALDGFATELINRRDVKDKLVGLGVLKEKGLGEYLTTMDGKKLILMILMALGLLSTPFTGLGGVAVAGAAFGASKIH